MQVYQIGTPAKKWRIRPAHDFVWGQVWDVYDTSLGWVRWFVTLDAAVDYVYYMMR